ncbi:hypothetical protein [Pasteurella bettyae]|uniref:Uncharacterized protein n=1 Tax=Pasteurella bettyae CCUG 2042 TaxID=1095749 RepID=I3DKB0_9PAST|nr:hypothetical protein [Pasteurella bettyae]EIJ72153.1 hypothetical protein HMPREF1052_2052 [Pasteurella bettyae CCUG 2042]SUB20785.1 Uncharacterised protein [Pasteurella bettyae]
MNDFFILTMSIAKANWDVLAVMLGMPMLTVLGLMIAESLNKK